MNQSSIDLKVQLGRLRLQNPILVASGTFGYAREIKGFVDFSRLGGILPKTITQAPRAGNAPWRTIETTGGMLNSIGLDNDGIDAFIAKHMPYLGTLDTAIVVSIAGHDYDEFVQAVMADVLAEGGEKAHHAVATYYNPANPFTGSTFETLADRDHPDRITAKDIVAVSTLSVNIPGEVAVWLLRDEGRLQVSSLLVNVPANIDLWDRPDLLAPEGDLWRLWHLLDEACWPRPKPQPIRTASPRSTSA